MSEHTHATTCPVCRRPYGPELHVCNTSWTLPDTGEVVRRLERIETKLDALLRGELVRDE